MISIISTTLDHSSIREFFKQQEDRKMKKIIKVVLAITMIFAASGCASYETTDATSSTKTTESAKKGHATKTIDVTEKSDTTDTTKTTKTTNASETTDTTVTSDTTVTAKPVDKRNTSDVINASTDVQVMAKDLVDKLQNAYEDDDEDTFTNCFVDADDPTIDQLWNFYDENDPMDYDTTSVIVIAHQDDLYGISVVDYTVDGDFPNDDMDSNSYSFVAKNVDGGLKVDGSQKSIDTITEGLMNDDNMFPDGFVSAYKAGRNVVNLNNSNYLFLSDDPVYDGTSQNFVKFIWQEEDGSLGVEILVQNGTNQDIHYTDGTITLTDSGLGEIGTWNFDVDETVPAGKCYRYIYSIDASEVNTGTQTWNEVSADCYLDFD